MPPEDALARKISALLLALVVFDAVLTIWAFGFPQQWFDLFHGVPYAGKDPEALLQRAGANWAAFCLVQLVAWRRWRAQVGWLAVVAGVRLSDVFTDITYVALCEHRTWFAAVTLPLMGCVNAILGWTFWRWYRRGRLDSARSPE